jgi:hypothetical protein
MTRATITIALLLTLAACSDPAPEFAAVAITLPDDDGAFPDGPGVEAVTNNCGACHSPSMILNQPRLTRAEWQKSIDKMRKVFKAEIDPADEAAILSYLDATSAAVR